MIYVKFLAHHKQSVKNGDGLVVIVIVEELVVLKKASELFKKQWKFSSNKLLRGNPT